MRKDIRPELSVDTSVQDKVEIHLDIVFPSLPCAVLSINAMDKTGDHQLNIHDNIFTTRVSRDGTPIADAVKEVVGVDKHEATVDIKEHLEQPTTCGDCYGAETEQHPCCNTCDEVKDAYRRKGWAFQDVVRIKQCVAEGYVQNLQQQREEGCRVHGFVSVNRVSGNVNIVPGKFVLQNTRYVMDATGGTAGLNLSHVVNKLSFGKEYPGMKNPLDQVTKVTSGHASGAMYHYFLKVVPTFYTDIFGSTIKTNQYSVLEYITPINMWGGSTVPGVFFTYDLSPIRVDLKESSKSFLHFLTNLCAIVGGVFTVASLVDAFLFQGVVAIKQKLLRREKSFL